MTDTKTTSIVDIPQYSLRLHVLIQ